MTIRYQAQIEDDPGSWEPVGQPEDTIDNALAVIRRHMVNDLEGAEPGTDFTTSLGYRIEVVEVQE